MNAAKLGFWGEEAMLPTEEKLFFFEKILCSMKKPFTFAAAFEGKQEQSAENGGLKWRLKKKFST